MDFRERLGRNIRVQTLSWTIEGTLAAVNPAGIWLAHGLLLQEVAEAEGKRHREWEEVEVLKGELFIPFASLQFVEVLP